MTIDAVLLSALRPRTRHCILSVWLMFSWRGYCVITTTKTPAARALRPSRGRGRIQPLPRFDVFLGVARLLEVVGALLNDQQQVGQRESGVGRVGRAGRDGTGRAQILGMLVVAREQAVAAAHLLHCGLEGCHARQVGAHVGHLAVDEAAHMIAVLEDLQLVLGVHQPDLQVLWVVVVHHLGEQAVHDLALAAAGAASDQQVRSLAALPLVLDELPSMPTPTYQSGSGCPRRGGLRTWLR